MAIDRMNDRGDWRRGLLEAARHDAKAALQTTLDAGVDPAELQRFVREHAGVFGEAAAVFDDGRGARRASDRLLDQTQPSLRPPTSATGRAARPLAVRLDPHAALPWHQRVTLPPLPVTFATGAEAGDVVVQGERFRAGDVAALLAGC